jgi:N-acetyl-1-D-myo-inositol-2-amino-2-deoxy-alpha-D-glucopyranoside deacetylase
MSPSERGSLCGFHLLAFFAHPDDEAYSVGGTLALCTTHGARATLVCATRGERGIARLARRGAELAALRSVELSRSCEHLGVEPPFFLDLPDGSLDRYDAAQAGKQLADLLVRERPDVVITLGPDGAYGHRDHIACTRWVDCAFEQLASACPSRLLHTAFPAGLMEPIWSSLRRARQPVVSSELTPESFGTSVDRVDLRLPLGPARTRKLAAIAAHRSQLPSGEPRDFLWPGLVDALLDEEWFRLVRGPSLPAAAQHPFAGLRCRSCS